VAGSDGPAGQPSPRLVRPLRVSGKGSEL
jgi:hypothetical protein